MVLAIAFRGVCFGERVSQKTHALGVAACVGHRFQHGNGRIKLPVSVEAIGLDDQGVYLSMGHNEQQRVAVAVGRLQIGVLLVVRQRVVRHVSVKRTAVMEIALQQIARERMTGDLIQRVEGFLIHPCDGHHPDTIQLCPVTESIVGQLPEETFALKDISQR